MKKTLIVFVTLFALIFLSGFGNAQDLGRAMKRYKAKEYAQAIPDFINSIPSIEVNYGKSDTIYYGRLLLYTGISYKGIYDFQNAEKYLLQSNEVYKNAGALKNPQYAESFIELAGLYVISGKFDKAEKFNLKARTIYEHIYGKKSAKYALTCNNLASLYRKTGNYNKSEKLFIEAKNIYENLYGKKHPDYTVCCSNLASLYLEKGQYNKAEQLFAEVKDIDESLYGKDDKHLIRDYNNLGNLYVELGNYDKAEQLFLKAETILRTKVGTNNPRYAVVCNNLGQLYKLMNNYKDAETYFLKAKLINKNLYTTKNVNYLTVCNNLASLYFEKSNFKEAEKLFLEVLNSDKEILGTMHPDYASDCNNLGALYYYTGKYNKAIPLYLESKNIFQTVYGERHYNYALACSNVALVYAAEGKFKKAKPLFEEANSVLNYLVSESSKFMSEQERDFFLNTGISSNFDIYNSFFLDNVTKDKRLSGIVYDNALSLKSQLLKSTLVIRKTVLQSNDKEFISLYNKMNAVGKLLARQYTLPLEKRRTDILKLEEQKNNYEKKLTRKSQYFASVSDAEKLNRKDIQKSLSENETAIEFINFKYHDSKFQTNKIYYYALILRKNYQFPKAVFLFEEKKLQNLLHRNPELSEYNYIKKLYDPKSKSAAELFKLVWKPFENELKNSENVYISPSGLLNRISFDALPVDTANLLSDKYKIIYTVSTSEICNKTSLYQKDIKNSVLFGGIQYEMSPEEMLKQAQKFKSGFSSYNRLNINIDNSSTLHSIISDSLTRGLSWSFLPGSLDEAVEIKDVILKKDIDVKIFKGTEGSEEQFKVLEKEAPSIIHISTHGFYFGNDEESETVKSMISENVKFAHSDNPLLRSGFILAGGNRAFQGKEIPAGVEDGVLTALEISQLNLFNTKLAVLSACQTGLGDVKGHEGVYGLQRSFKMAGVEYLLFSLWEVPDKTTKELMEDFYKNWFDGDEIRTAFKKAQNQLKEKYAGVPGSAFAWAAFVLKK